MCWCIRGLRVLFSWELIIMCSVCIFIQGKSVPSFPFRLFFYVIFASNERARALACVVCGFFHFRSSASLLMKEGREGRECCNQNKKKIVFFTIDHRNVVRSGVDRSFLSKQEIFSRAIPFSVRNIRIKKCFHFI